MRSRLAALLALAPLAVLAGCGGSSSPDPTAGGRTSRAAYAGFPAAAGKTLAELRRNMPQGPILASSVSVLSPGRDRVGFALFDGARKQISTRAVALYAASSANGPLHGPYYAKEQSLAVSPRFRSKTTTADPDAAQQVYVAHVPFRRRGHWVLIGLARLDGRLVASTPVPAPVLSPRGGPPDVGQKAIDIHTPTVASVHGRQSLIETRQPPDPALQRVDFASVYGRKPVVLMFATPALCESRVCGPVVDIEAQLQHELGAKAAFIHVEVYNHNDANAGIRPQLLAYGLRTEPWTFVIDRHGRIVARLEGAFSPAELRRDVKRAIAVR